MAYIFRTKSTPETKKLSGFGFLSSSRAQRDIPPPTEYQTARFSGTCNATTKGGGIRFAPLPADTRRGTHRHDAGLQTSRPSAFAHTDTRRTPRRAAYHAPPCPLPPPRAEDNFARRRAADLSALRALTPSRPRALARRCAPERTSHASSRFARNRSAPSAPRAFSAVRLSICKAFMKCGTAWVVRSVDRQGTVPRIA